MTITQLTFDPNLLLWIREARDIFNGRKLYEKSAHQTLRIVLIRGPQGSKKPDLAWQHGAAPSATLDMQDSRGLTDDKRRKLLAKLIGKCAASGHYTVAVLELSEELSVEIFTCEIRGMYQL